MELRPFGKTGIRVTPLGLGLAALGRPGYINIGHAEDLRQKYAVSKMEARAHEVLDLAWENGIRFIDAARSYGKAEAFLNSWLEKRKPGKSELVVSSKWGYTYTANWEVQAISHEIKEHTLPVLRQQWQETKRYLGEFLNIYQIHSATPDSGVLTRQEVLNELAGLKAGGTIVGLSLSGPHQAETLKRAIEVEVDGLRLFDMVQASWNLLEPSVGSVLKEASDEGMGIVIKEALANGRLTDRNQAPQFASKLELLKQQAGICNTSVDALALAAVLAQPWVDVVLSGAATQKALIV